MKAKKADSYEELLVFNNKEETKFLNQEELVDLKLKEKELMKIIDQEISCENKNQELNGLVMVMQIQHIFTKLRMKEGELIISIIS